VTRNTAGARSSRPRPLELGDHPAFGARPERAGVRFRVFAPPGSDLRLVLSTGAAAGIHRPEGERDGVVEFFVPGAGAGDRYAFTIDGSDPRPDPASRYQPEGVHGPSEVIDPDAYRWRHTGWRGRDPRELVIYELHVGTFTAAGTFAGVRERLGALRELGVTAIELMPVADFPGSRNWGYDGVNLFAPARAYGRPDDLRALVDAAHGEGLAVLLDVVYNHLGPEGAYMSQFHPGYMTDRHTTPWGCAVNLDGPGSALVRSFLIDNAVHWIREYRLDGLRFDATHALIDTSPRHVVADLADAVRRAAPHPVALYAEDHRNLAAIVEPAETGGWGLDGIWADDFHHVVRRQLAGDTHGYYADFEGSCDELARTVRQGWLFTGQTAPHSGKPRGTDASSIPMRKFVVCLQNHDQIGNRATGDRLHHQIDSAAWRAASTILLTAPMTPLLFMGQEWAASSPFQYFTDLEPDLGRLVTEGRRKEFAAFPEFSDPEARQRIPDPQAGSTFEASRLNWDERATGVHRVTLALYTELLRLRAAHPALSAADDLAGEASAPGDGALVFQRSGNGEDFYVLARPGSAGAVTLAPGAGGNRAPRMIFTTEDERFALDPLPPAIDTATGQLVVRFQRPGAIILTFA
jgi:maltooligosyltrehalose trehalohydrolase